MTWTTTEIRPDSLSAPATDRPVHALCRGCDPDLTAMTALCGTKIDRSLGPQSAATRITCVVCDDLAGPHVINHLRG